MYRYRLPSRNHDLGHVRLNARVSTYTEFKYLYFRLQKLLNKEVNISLKYEQLKSPEVKLSIVKPLVEKVIGIGTRSHLLLLAGGGIGDTLRPLMSVSDSGSLLSPQLFYVLLLLRYEYLIQSENNLIMFDLLQTKATMCEILAIRMLREYRSVDRINMLFLNPMLSHGQENEILKNTKHLDSFNTLELSVLSKSKRLLSQPVIVSILDRIYNGELIVRDHLYMDKEEELSLTLEEAEAVDGEKNVVNYRFNRVSIHNMAERAHTVPKYQSLVINMKYAFLTVLFFLLVLKHKHKTLPGDNSIPGTAFSVLFWLLALSFNFDLLQRLLHIEYKFLKKIIWVHIDIIITVMIDVAFVLRILLQVNRVSAETYYSFFSLISILLFPRMLSVFNNYEFFNMMIVSFKKMSLNMIAMFCLFVSLIFGFFLCFITITIDLSTYEVAFSMLKLFFGFTPAVWDNWDSYNDLGRAIQLAYLFLIQFIVATILAIVLSNVFSEVSQTNKLEFEYLKTTNLIIYLKAASLNWSGSNNGFLRFFTAIVNLFKFPIVVLLYAYELIIKRNKNITHKQRRDLKNFTFLNKEDDFYSDLDLILAWQQDEDSDVSTVQGPSSRRNSQLPGKLTENLRFAGATRNQLIPQKLQNTLPGFRSELLDLIFMDNFFGKKYGLAKLRSRDNKDSRPQVRTLSAKKSMLDVMAKLMELESKLDLLSAGTGQDPDCTHSLSDIDGSSEASVTSMDLESE